jgi:hypothetical protein
MAYRCTSIGRRKWCARNSGSAAAGAPDVGPLRRGHAAPGTPRGACRRPRSSRRAVFAPPAVREHHHGSVPRGAPPRGACRRPRPLRTRCLRPLNFGTWSGNQHPPLRQNPLLSIHHRVEASRASIQDPPRNHPRRDRGMPTPLIGGDRDRGVPIPPRRIGGCRPPLSGGASKSHRDRGCRRGVCTTPAGASRGVGAFWRKSKLGPELDAAEETRFAS